MSPTRELTLQIFQEAKKLCFNSKYRAVVIYGGTSARGQLEELSFGVDIAVATPGRLMDFIDRSLVDLSCIQSVVLDEADRMLDMGFLPQIRKVLENRNMPEKGNRKNLMFSATFPTDIQQLAQGINTHNHRYLHRHYLKYII